MAFRDSAAVCSLPTYQTFMPLAGFPPALGYCSTTAFINRRTNHITGSLQTPREVQCPAGNNHLCDLLSELKASDHEFTRTTCCCIGVCLGIQPTDFVTVSISTFSGAKAEPSVFASRVDASTPSSVDASTASRVEATSRVRASTTSSVDASTTTSEDASTTSSVDASTTSNATSSTVTAASSVVSMTSAISSGTTSSMFQSRQLSTSTSSTSLLSSSSSSSVPSRTDSASASSTSSSSSSSSSSTTATCPSTVTADPSCTSIVVMGGLTVNYTQYYSGNFFVESTNNPGNDQANYPPIYNSIPGTLDMCDAASNCANMGDPPNSTVPSVYYSFDLHYLASNATWECVLYYDPNTDPSYFSVADPDACLTFGYAQATVE